MPTLRHDSVLQEYSFTSEEVLSSALLSDLQVKRLHTMYAQLFKEKASVPMPEEMSLDRSYFLRMAELEGRLAILQQLIDDHISALKETAARKQNVPEVAQVDLGSLGNLEQRASTLINNSPF